MDAALTAPDEARKLAREGDPDQIATLETFVALLRAGRSRGPRRTPTVDLYGAALSHWNLARKRRPVVRRRV